MKGYNIKYENSSYQYDAYNFIPIVGQYDDNTIITKNGELIQTIKIEGLNRRNIPDNLEDLRAHVQLAIKRSFNSRNIALWMQVVRKKINLHYHPVHTRLFCNELSKAWEQRYQWNDRYSNILYISFIHKPADLRLRNIHGFMTSLSMSSVKQFYMEYLHAACQTLSQLTTNIINELHEFEPTKLGISIIDEIEYSDSLSYFKYIIQRDEAPVPLSRHAFDKVIGCFPYAVGSDVLEINLNDQKKFIATIFLKEYRNIASSTMESILQTSNNFVLTEICYIADHQSINTHHKYSDYILKVSGDKELSQIKKYDALTNSEHKYEQQIMLTICETNIATLETQVLKMSNKLAAAGIVHAREDIMLEQSFWAQIPGNFKFLRRTNHTIDEDICGFAAVYNYDIGDFQSQWGEYITIFKTETHTPFFFNFHHKKSSGHTHIYGGQYVGKTTVMNFLISEATKLSPTILYISNNNHSRVFIQAIGGTWCNQASIFNPLLLLDSPDNHIVIFEFFKIICNHHEKELSQDALNTLAALVSFASTISKDQRTISYILTNFDFASFADIGNAVKKLLSVLLNEKYSAMFDTDNHLELKSGDILGIGLDFLSDQTFKQKYYPQDDALVSQYFLDLEVNRNVRMAYVLSILMPILDHTNSYRHILAMDDFLDLCGHKYLLEIYGDIADLVTKNNGIMITTSNVARNDLLMQQLIDLQLQYCDTNIVMPTSIDNKAVAERLHMSSEEKGVFLKLTIKDRLFIVKYDEKLVVLELNLATLPKLLQILTVRDIKVATAYNQLLEDCHNDVDAVLPKFYDVIEI